LNNASSGLPTIILLVTAVNSFFRIGALKRHLHATSMHRPTEYRKGTAMEEQTEWWPDFVLNFRLLGQPIAIEDNLNSCFLSNSLNG
jgi:hypothetical protein